MPLRREAKPVYRPTVEKVANCIHDPVARLRFLQATAPRVTVPAPVRWIRSARQLLAGSRIVRFVLLAAAGLTVLGSVALMVSSTRAEVLTAPRQPIRPSPVADAPPPNVWMVENSGQEETYSNGLRIDNRHVVPHYPRSYVVFPASGHGPAVRRYDPAGIVFHTTESHQVPFEAVQNDALRRVGESLLEYVQRKFAYHFLIDRFGRVHRVVAEGDAADHAGPSLWADRKWLYVNLNRSFLAVSLEGRTEPGQNESGASPAQVRAAAMLTEMLRSRYGIAAENCVTHAQVSVNPANMQVGYHTDWASGFPFEQVGLPNNYAEALPAVWAFGFLASAEYRAVTGERLAEGVDRAEETVRAGAQAEKSSIAAYRKRLQEAYRQKLAELN
jgi:N-acetylmuramoyl-L-alanine amidase